MLRRTPLATIAFALAGALLVAGVPLLLFQSGSHSGSGVDLGVEPVVPSTVPHPAKALMPELQAFVERTRGLEFKRPVRVQILEDEAFERRIRRLVRMTVVEARRRQRVMQALGLIGPDVDFNLVQQMIRAATVLGLYDASTSSLIVRGSEPTPLLRSVLVHELTHAVQDQHFDLDRQSRRLRRAAQGFQAVVEGDARRVQSAYEDTLSASELSELERELIERAAAIPGDVPAPLAALNAFPYRVGERFTSTLVALSGQSELDAAFSEPPTTAEQLLHPDRFVAQEGEIDVPTPDGDGRVIQVDTLGEFGLQVLLGETAPEEQVRQATQGWGGDRYVAWADGDRNCVRLNIVMDTSTDADELAEVLVRWARQSGAAVEGRQPLVVTSCR